MDSGLAWSQASPRSSPAQVLPPSFSSFVNIADLAALSTGGLICKTGALIPTRKAAVEIKQDRAYKVDAPSGYYYCGRSSQGLSVPHQTPPHLESNTEQLQA